MHAHVKSCELHISNSSDNVDGEVVFQAGTNQVDHESMNNSSVPEVENLTKKMFNFQLVVFVARQGKKNWVNKF